jgi:anti-sigma factor RsiW
MNAARDLPCVEFVDLVTTYLDDALPADVRERVDVHLDGCEGCRNVLAQWRTVIRLTSRLSPRRRRNRPARP